MPKSACRDCRFLVRFRDDDVRSAGECHRLPPQAVVTADDSILSVLPQVDPGHWCGEFQPHNPHDREVTRG
jgi:hypothetical protein